MSDNSARRDAALKNLDKELKSRARREKMRPLGVVLATVVVLVVLVGGIWFAVTRDNTPDTVAEETTAALTDTTEPGPKDCAYTSTGDASREVSLPSTDGMATTGTTKVTLATTQGNIDLTLDHGQAPCAANAIEHLVKEKFYDDTICHRVVVSEGMKMLQCGDPTGIGTGGPGFSFPDEYPVWDADGNAVQEEGLYKRGVLAMANSGENTNGSQFFLVQGDSQLPNDYTIFGTISEEGLETLDKVIEENRDTEGADGAGGTPDPEVRITSATVDA